MKSMSRRAFLLSALVAVLLWAPASTDVTGASGRGIHLTRNGFRTHVYGMSSVRDASGNLGSACSALSAPEVDAQRFGRRVSRAMAVSSPKVVVRGPEGGATFDVTYIDAEGEGFNDTANGATRRRALETALSAWTKVLKADQPIRVEATMFEMDDEDDDPTTTLLATAGPSEFWIIENKAVPSPLAWQMLGGRYDNAGDADISVNVNEAADWDYATNGVAARGKFSFVYTLMHELAHGLGFIDSFDIETGKLLNEPTPFVYDEFVNRGSARRNRVMDHASEEKIRDMTSGDVFFNGSNAAEAVGRSFRPGPMLKLYAPNPFEPGSSISHVDQDTYADIRTGLMTPIDFGSGTDKIDPLTLAVMKDMGYQLVPNAVTTRVR